MLPEKLFFWRSSILRDDMAEFWPQVGGSVPVREFPLRSSVCSSGSVCLPPCPHLYPSHVSWHTECLGILPLSIYKFGRIQPGHQAAVQKPCQAERMMHGRSALQSVRDVFATALRRYHS